MSEPSPRDEAVEEPEEAPLMEIIGWGTMGLPSIGGNC